MQTPNLYKESKGKLNPLRPKLYHIRVCRAANILIPKNIIYENVTFLSKPLIYTDSLRGIDS